MAKSRKGAGRATGKTKARATRRAAKPKKRTRTTKAAARPRTRSARPGGGTTAHSRRSDPETSRIAAKAVSTSELEKIVYDDVTHSGNGGRTTDEATDSTGRDKVSVSPRFRPLCNKGLLFASKEKRLGHSGKLQTVWKLVKYRKYEKKAS